MLKWIERTLLMVGVLLTGWIALTVLEARRVDALPVPPASQALEPTLAPPLRGSWIALLEISSVNLSSTVLEGSDDATLARAAGHIENTALPGQAGNVGIAGHRDTTFRRLRRVKVGDVLRLTTPDAVLEYRISNTSIVPPEAVEVLAPTERPTLTLVTCYPFTFVGHAPERFIVRAELVEKVKGKAGRPASSRPAAVKAVSGVGRSAVAPRQPRKSRCCPESDRRSRRASSDRLPASSFRFGSR